MRRSVSLFLFFVLLLSCLSACLPSAVDSGDVSGEGQAVENGSPLTERVLEPTSHTAVQPAAYYQYSTLSGAEKTAYDRLREGALTGKNNIDVSDLQISRERANYITRKLTADNPQFFYLSKTVSYTYSAETDFLFSYQLLYTDGTVVDRYDGSALAEAADRTVIDGQIRQFNQAVSQAVAAIPADLSEGEKEKRIHDYIVSIAEYDSEAAKLTDAAAVLPRAFDAYGALCTGKATCEGYAKLFQYLCYCVGINGTQLVGTAEGGPHMWNAVCVEGDWYLVDVTWDDPVGNESNLPVYDYYNLTTAEMEKNHTPDREVLAVPSCVSEKLAFPKNYALCPENGKLPSNYRGIIDRLAAGNEPYLLVYTSDVSDIRGFLSEEIFREDCDLVSYIKEKNYNLSFETTYALGGKYAYLTVKRG